MAEAEAAGAPKFPKAELPMLAGAAEVAAGVPPNPKAGAADALNDGAELPAAVGAPADQQRQFSHSAVKQRSSRLTSLMRQGLKHRHAPPNAGVDAPKEVPASKGESN